MRAAHVVRFKDERGETRYQFRAAPNLLSHLGLMENGPRKLKIATVEGCRQFMARCGSPYRSAFLWAELEILDGRTVSVEVEMQ